jgi:hypothetical protein
MRDLDLLIPSALVDPSLAPDLLRDVAMPHLARVLAHGTPDAVAWPAQRALASWQAWVFAVRAGVPVESVNVAELWAMACGVPPASGRWLAEPAHFRIAKDHLRLADIAGLAVTLAEARTLLAAIEPVLEDAGWHVDTIEPATLKHWFLSRRDDAAISAPAIDRAIGDNVAAWQPRTTGALSSEGDAGSLAWRRCVNEVQMIWFGHPVNDAREAAGRDAINTLWLSGNGAPRTPLPRYAAVDASLPLLAALPIEPDASRTLESFDRLIAPARADDWSTWRDELAALDARIGAIVDAQRAGDVGVATFAFCGLDRVVTATLRPGDGKRFWRRWGRQPTLAAWFADETAT